MNIIYQESPINLTKKKKNSNKMANRAQNQTEKFQLYSSKMKFKRHNISFNFPHVDETQESSNCSDKFQV